MLGIAKRIAELPADDWRKRHPDFNEPRLAHNLKVVRVLRAIGRLRGRSAAEVAVAWVLHNPAVTGAIVGGRRAEQVQGVLGASDFSLGARELAEIEAFVSQQAA